MLRQIPHRFRHQSNTVLPPSNQCLNMQQPLIPIELNVQSRKKVEEIRSFILDGAIPYVTFVMLNNGLAWNQEGQNHINNAFAGQCQVRFEHFSHKFVYFHYGNTSKEYSFIIKIFLNSLSTQRNLCINYLFPIYKS